MNRFLIYILLTIPSFALSQSLPQDSSSVEVRSFDENIADRYTDEVFKYEATVEGEAKNFISRGISAIINTLSDWFGFQPDPETYRLVELIVYGLLIMIALYLVIRLLMGHSATQIFGKKDQELTPMSFEERDIERLDLERAMLEALSNGDYRLGLRYHYLIVLQLLSNKGLIQWHFQKTNLDYIREIQHSGIQTEFRDISLVFERIWYGEYPMDEGRYQDTAVRFETLKKQIGNAG